MARSSDPRATPTKPFTQPFLGLHLDRPQWTIDPRGLADCNNVRIASGNMDSRLSGWKATSSATLDGKPVRGVFDAQVATNFLGETFHVIGTTTDLILVEQTSAFYATPTYRTGTVSVSGTSVTGVGTTWNTSIGGGFRNNVRAGDQIAFVNTSPIVGGATWFTVQSVNSDTSLTLTTSAGTIGAGSGYIVRQCFSTADPFHQGIYPWFFEVYPAAGAPDNGDVLVAVNGNPNDCVVKLEIGAGSSTFVYVPTMPFQAGTVRRMKNLMVYGNLYNPTTLEFLPTSIANSDNGFPFTMAGGVAGQFIVSDGPLGINTLDVLGNTLMIYMGSPQGGDVVGATYVGGTVGWSFTEIIRGRGPISGRCVAAFPDRHQFLTPEGEYRYNGLFIQPMNTQVWRGLTTLFDYSRAQRAHCTINPALGDLVWAVPLTTDSGQAIQTAYVEHYMEQANNYLFKPFTKRDWPFSAAAPGWLPGASGLVSTASLTPQTIVGDENGAVWQAFVDGNQGQALDGTGGTTPTSFTLHPQRLVINERSRGLVKRVYPFVDKMATGTLTVTLTLFDQIGGAAAITDTQIFDPTYAGNRFTVHYRRGRLAQVKISGNSGWVLEGGDWDVAPGGLR